MPSIQNCEQINEHFHQLTPKCQMNLKRKWFAAEYSGSTFNLGYFCCYLYCTFGQSKAKYVGHIVFATTDLSKIETVITWPQPTDLKTLRSFLRICEYYIWFIANYSVIVRPLMDLRQGYAPKQHRMKSVTPRNFTSKIQNPLGRGRPW